MSKEIATIKEILSYIGTTNYSFVIDSSTKITGFNSISDSNKGEVTFCSSHDDNGINLIKNTDASLVICHDSLKDRLGNVNVNLIFVDRPRLWFLRCMRKFLENKKFTGIHKTAIVETKQIGKNVYIGPFSFIQKEVVIGDNTIIHNNVSVFNKTKIGSDVIVDSGAVIGTDGFGFERNESSELEFFPHLGGVIIEDQVEIGANTCIDRGTLNDTVIGKETKIDNFVHVAHNVQIGKNCLIVAKALLGGGSVIEDSVHVAMSATIRDGIKVGRNSIVGMGSVVTKNVSENVTVMGVPAKPVNH